MDGQNCATVDVSILEFTYKLKPGNSEKVLDFIWHEKQPRKTKTILIRFSKAGGLCFPDTVIFPYIILPAKYIFLNNEILEKIIYSGEIEKFISKHTLREYGPMQ